MRKIIVTVLTFLVFRICMPLYDLDSSWANSPDRNLSPSPREIPDNIQNKGIFISTGLYEGDTIKNRAFTVSLGVAVNLR